MTNVAALTLEQKLEEVVHRAARLLPGDAGRRLLAFVSPESLATMAAVVVIWAGSHFFGVGEIADVILLLGGIATVGMTAVDGGKTLKAFAVTGKTRHPGLPAVPTTAEAGRTGTRRLLIIGVASEW